jgi:ATP-dependent exoDNAse (exonuclease V) alpha subunit
VIASGAAPVIRLTEVFRQAAQSRIITSAHRINRGSLPDLGPGRRGQLAACCWWCVTARTMAHSLVSTPY